MTDRKMDLGKTLRFWKDFTINVAEEYKYVCMFKRLLNFEWRMK